MIRIRPMTAADLPLGLRLSTQAGWNQTEADWRRFLRLQPDGCFVAELDGLAAGTTCCFVCGPVAWVGMVLVDEALRGRGVGTALMRHALAFLDGCGVQTVRLDATPLGRPIYEKLGFVAEYSLARYGGILQPTGADPPVTWLRRAWLPVVRGLDEAVTQADRYRFLIRLFSEYPDTFRVLRDHPAVNGYLSSRPGANAVHIGPCIATDEDAGRLLFADAAVRYAGQRVFIDVPLPNGAAVATVEAMGLTVQRTLLRMGRGESMQERVEELWASSGPEKG